MLVLDDKLDALRMAEGIINRLRYRALRSASFAVVDAHLKFSSILLPLGHGCTCGISVYKPIYEDKDRLIYLRRYSIYEDMTPPPAPEQPRPLTRSEKAQDIVFKKGAMRRIDANTYIVQSQSGNGEYMVISTENGWVCACPDNSYRKIKCKHIFAVEISLELRDCTRPCYRYSRSCHTHVPVLQL